MSLGMLAFGAAALTAAVAFHQGWSPHWHRRQPATSGESTAERIGRNLREPSRARRRRGRRLVRES